MLDQFKIYSFDDEPVIRFCSDLNNKEIKLYFSAYYNKGNYVERKCIFSISDWSDAYIQINRLEKKYSIENALGIISMILHIENVNEELRILVSTVDGRYLNIYFFNVLTQLRKE